MYYYYYYIFSSSSSSRPTCKTKKGKLFTLTNIRLPAYKFKFNGQNVFSKLKIIPKGNDYTDFCHRENFWELLREFETKENANFLPLDVSTAQIFRKTNCSE